MRSVENCGRYGAVLRASEREEREETHEKTASFISFTNLLFIGLILWAAIETLLALVSPQFFFWVRSSFILIFYVKYSDFLGCVAATPVLTLKQLNGIYLTCLHS